MQSSVIEKYILKFSDNFKKKLKPSVRLSSTVYQLEDKSTTIIDFKIGKYLIEQIKFMPPYFDKDQMFNAAQVRSFSDSFNNLKFSGTNFILEPDRIILIKDNSTDEWNGDAAMNDVNKLLTRNNISW